ncbi:hypothetical protein DO71_6081 [Burkholderia pseudomallei]|nr:hypothetical protein DO71_6081 [Burkholderia pseudomallei]
MLSVEGKEVRRACRVACRASRWRARLSGPISFYEASRRLRFHKLLMRGRRLRHAPRAPARDRMRR